ncbi:MAG: hypothetical protein LiPW15_489 [Parcubacteria group bacterium LiPW_15]|nr:MAG: hypothetical protein LiPW15_489 [Parcubacteria group bacterium LiPW_15]
MYEAKIVVSDFAGFRNAFRGVKSWEQKLHLFEASVTGEAYPVEFVSASIEEVRAHAEFQATDDPDGGDYPLSFYEEKSDGSWAARSVSGMCGLLQVTPLPDGKTELRLIFASKGGTLLAAVKAAGWAVYGF